jgi:drug/metabolite transporter (DMT)-like permease
MIDLSSFQPNDQIGEQGIWLNKAIPSTSENGAGGAHLVGLPSGRIEVLISFGTPQWIAGIYLGVGGGALALILWVLALQRATPTRVANTMTVNPIAAGLLATQLVGEPITPNLIVRLVAVFAGIWIATTEVGKA